MISWLLDRWWAWKNHDALERLDKEMDALRAQQQNLERRVKELFGPDWRQEAERRFQERLAGHWTV